MAKRVLVMTRDLFFRSKIDAIVKAAGGSLTRDEVDCDIAVIELGGPGVEERVRELLGLRVQVIVFGSHLKADDLRAIRSAGALAVPNSEVEQTLRGML